MKQILLAVLCALTLQTTSAQVITPELAKTMQQAKVVPPFKVFDNLYYVGIDWVSAFLIPTSDGLILIDTLYGEFTNHAIDSIRKLGFDPADIKYVLITHAHFDHAGGAAVIKALSGARIAMTAADWDLLEADRKAGRLRHVSVSRDLVLKDGDVLALGGERLKFFVTPGHTPGVLSIQFNARSGRQQYRAFMFGGVGLNFDGVKRTEQYLASLGKIRELGPVDVNVSNHPAPGDLLTRAEKLRTWKEGLPHPFVDRDGFTRWLAKLETDAKLKLQQERQKAGKRPR